MSSSMIRVRDKTVIARAPIETDWATYCTVSPDQNISEPLIPYKNPVKQLDWRILFNKGVIYSPTENVGVYGRIVEIKYGCQIRGNVFAKENIIAQSGFSLKSSAKEDEWIPGRIYGPGNLICQGKLEIKEPTHREKDQYGDWRASDPRGGDEYPLVIDGNVICDSAAINSGVYIKGNLIARNDIIIRPREDYNFVKIKGAVYSLNGKIELDRCFCKTVRGFKDITINGLVALDVPVMMSIEGQIIMNGENREVYVVDKLICSSCLESTSIDDISRLIRTCKNFLSGDCPKGSIEKLTKFDLIPYRNGMILARTWRTFRESKSYRVEISE